MQALDAVVIGAGHAGLSVSYFLKQDGRSHVVFERGEVGETWRSQRWDSFALNTPNSLNGLPGAAYEGDEPDGFWLRDELVNFFQQYVDRFELPIHRRTLSIHDQESSGCTRSPLCRPSDPSLHGCAGKHCWF